jgi:hypothetical protein
MGDVEIEQNLVEKKKILSWLINKEIRSLDQLGKVINLYYKDKKSLLDKLNANKLQDLLK